MNAKKLIIGLISLLVALEISCKSDIMDDPKPDNETEEESPEKNEGPLSAMGDYLVATDDLGRTLPGYQEVGPEKDDRFVGLFYWLWHTKPIRYDRTDDYNVTKN